MRYLMLLLFVCLSTFTTAQRALLFEKLTNSKSEKVYEGEMLRFRLQGDNFWQEGPIREMRPDIQALVINDRFIMLDEIEKIDQGGTFFGAAGIGMMSFGLGWSVFAAAGYNTDGDPTTQYSGMDLGVTLTSVGLGYLLKQTLGRKRFKTGKHKRLRIVDLNF